MSRRPSVVVSTLSAVTVGALAWCAQPSTAEACGGTFCDAGPQAMPVDQSGENILFVMEDGHVEAHIQIQYTGNPEQFAWIVPVMEVPDVLVGSDPLFTNMLAGTVPTFTLNTRSEDNCMMDDSAGGIGCSATDALASFDGEGGAPEDDDPQVVKQDTVGAFEYSVLQGGTVQGVVQWLDENGYAQDDDAPQILEEYLQEGFLFVAFKLQSGTDLNEIHPVVVRYPGTEPCVPIRLTRIAAEDDMGIRAFFLGDARVVPTNYRHVEINLNKIDWLNLGANYVDVVTQAVDEAGADGHAFVTEYAGNSNVIAPGGIHSETWNSVEFAEIEPADLTDTLQRQGLIGCAGTDCVLGHPLIEGLLNTYFPPPQGVAESEFYACTSCYADQVDPEQWDPSGFAAAFEERIVGPAEHALDLLALPYLTRLFTTISPGEMTEDPLFHENPELANVTNQYTATQVIDCEGRDRLELPTGRAWIFDEGDIPPDFSSMPFARRIEEIARAGAPMALVDNTDAINDEVDAWNRAQSPRQGCDCRSSRRHYGGAFQLGLLLLLGLRARRRRGKQVA